MLNTCDIVQPACRGDVKRFLMIIILKYTWITEIKIINQIINIQTLFCKIKDVFDVRKSNRNEHLFDIKSTNSNSMK